MIKLKSLLVEIHNNPPSNLVKIVDQILQNKNTLELLKKLNINIPKISYIRDNKREALARYIAGTSNNPQIEIDLDTIAAVAKENSSNLGYAIESTIIHELIHAYLESAGLDTSEHDENVVEDATREYMDFRDPMDAIRYLDDSYPDLEVLRNALPSVKVITDEVLTNIVDAAQKQYNEWNQNADGVDEELGTGGICHLIADELASIISDNGVECSTVSSSHEQHVYLVCQFREGVYEIDIPYGVYETGGGYNWKKLPNVIFDKSHVIVNKRDSDPNKFNNYID